MKENHRTTKKLDKKLIKHAALSKNDSSIRNIGIKHVKWLIFLHLFYQEFS